MFALFWLLSGTALISAGSLIGYFCTMTNTNNEKTSIGVAIIVGLIVLGVFSGMSACNVAEGYL